MRDDSVWILCVVMVLLLFGLVVTAMAASGEITSRGAHIDTLCARLSKVEPDLDATARALMKADRGACLLAVEMREKAGVVR